MTGFTINGISPKESANGILKSIDYLNKNYSGRFGMPMEKFCLGNINTFVLKRFISLIC